MLLVYADLVWLFLDLELLVLFQNYVETLLASLTQSWRVRVAAAESMPLLLECARVRGPEYLTQMWHFMCDALIKAIGTEPDSDVLSEIMHSFAKVITLWSRSVFILQSASIRTVRLGTVEIENVNCSVFVRYCNWMSSLLVRRADGRRVPEQWTLWGAGRHFERQARGAF